MNTNLKIKDKFTFTNDQYSTILNYIQGDMRKLKFATDILLKSNETDFNYEILNIFIHPS